MTYEFFAQTDRGRVRANNEDAVAVDREAQVAVLADGMGGYNAGEIASGMAITYICTEMSRWLAQETLPWRYGFSYARPAQDEQYQVYLGPDLHFSVGVDVMMIEKHWLEKAWPRGSATAYQVALREAQPLIGGEEATNGFNEAVYHYLTRQLRTPQSLPEVSRAFAMSPATFKRKLQKHHCHFQQLQSCLRAR